MSQTKREPNRQTAGRSTDPRTEPKQDATQDTMGVRASGRSSGADEITDEQLGLLATDERDRVSDVIGPDSEDAELDTDGSLSFVPGTLSTDVDFEEAGRQAQAAIIAEETDLTTTPHQLGEDHGAVAEVEPSWTDQPLITDPAAAVGDPDDASDPVSDLDETYTPPTDPVVTTSASGEVEILGGFSASGSERIVPRRSSDGQIGDEAIVDAVQAALRLDAATTDLDIAVTASAGVVRLRGVVADLDDADNAEAVASRVEGVVEVQEQLEIANG